MKVALRGYQPADFETLHKVDHACYPAEMAYSRAELRAYLGFFGAECIVAEIEANSGAPGHNGHQNRARIVGFCISARRGGEGHIITMDVLEEFRRHGIGSLLLAEIERRLVATGVERAGLETATDNEPAIAFWRRHGYVSVGVKKGYYSGRRDAYYMTKGLDALPGPTQAEPEKPSETPRGRRPARRKRRG